MASITPFKICKEIGFFLCLVLVSSLAVAAGRTSAECIGMLEGSGSYTSRPSPLGHQGKYQMGVAAMIEAGFCERGHGATQTSNQTQLWGNCILTAKGKSYGVQANANGTINLLTFNGNGTAQEAAYAGYKAQNRVHAANLYRDYTGKTINGTVMTEDVIDYLVHHGGPGGAATFLNSNGQNCVADTAVNSSLCKSAKKMSDCMGGATVSPNTPGGGMCM
jgi:hypothetical protein